MIRGILGCWNVLSETTKRPATRKLSQWNACEKRQHALRTSLSDFDDDTNCVVNVELYLPCCLFSTRVFLPSSAVQNLWGVSLLFIGGGIRFTRRQVYILFSAAFDRGMKNMLLETMYWAVLFLYRFWTRHWIAWYVMFDNDDNHDETGRFKTVSCHQSSWWLNIRKTNHSIMIM